MQAIGETAFDVIYLTFVMSFGVIIIVKGKGRLQYMLFGIMALVLGFGDAFHLVPRAYALCTTGLDDFATALGIGKLITSVTMTVFYVILYHVWRERYGVNGKHALTCAVYALAAVRIALCALPQNEWTAADAPLSWGIYRNIPFVILGGIIIALFYISANKHVDKHFRFMWLAIVLSFAFYIPVVVGAGAVPLLGMLMIPKTCAYMWAVWMGYSALKNDIKAAQQNNGGAEDAGDAPSDADTAE